MAGTLVIGVVPGVTPDKWVRLWRERMPAVPLEIRPLADEGAGAALLADVDMVFARMPIEGVDLDLVHVIPLWEETPLVVAARDHPVKVFDTVTLADLADEEHREGWDEGVLDLVAAGRGVARMPQSVFRAIGRRDLVGRPITDAEPSRIGLAWLRSSAGAVVDEFVGVVRGRTTNSSRGTATAPEAPPPPRPRRPPRQHRHGSRGR